LRPDEQTERSAINKKRPLAAIFGCSGTALNAEEKSFFRDADPLGFIIFSRNVENPSQLQQLVSDLRETVGRENAPVLIDQEGGRVARLGQPNWPTFPPAETYAKIFAHNNENGITAAYLGGRLIGHELFKLGITVDCAPVLDIPQADADPIIGDRAFGNNAETIITLARAFSEGLMYSGVAPVIKHIPGHGRALVDSHKHLPQVDATMNELEMDFSVFHAMNYMPWAMTAHVVYTAIDDKNPATLSTEVIANVIRKQIGFRGFLVSDDLSMKALEGEMQTRAQLALAAGCDAVLHCNGDMAEMKNVASGARQITSASWARFKLGNLQRHIAGEEEKEEDEFDVSEARKSFDSLIGSAGKA